MAKQTEPLRGEAAYNAEKKEIAARNEAAYARGRRERAARHTAWVARRQEEARQADVSQRRRAAR